MKKKIEKWFASHRDELTGDIARLVAVKSVRTEPEGRKPFGPGPAEAVSTAADMMYEYGFDVRNFGNIVVTGDTNSKPPKLGILAHLDVVPAGEGWDTDPFQVAEKDGRLYGRGVSDDKGPAVAALYAMRCARELCPDMKKGCRIILGSAEETGSEDLAYYSKIEDYPPMVFTPDGEFPVVNFEKGRYAPKFSASWEKSDALPGIVYIHGGDTTNIVPNKASALVRGISAETAGKFCREYSAITGAELAAAEEDGGIRLYSEGKASHGSDPAGGVNAQTALIKMLAAMPMAESGSFKAVKELNALLPHGEWDGESLGIKMWDDVSGDLTVNFGVLELSETGLEGDIDCRAPACAGEDNFIKPLRGAFLSHGFMINGNDAYAPPHYTPEDSEFVQTLLRVYEEFTGEKGKCLAIGGGSYVHDIEGGVCFGCSMPGVNTNMHGDNEFMPVDDLILAAEMFTMAIMELCG